jgi:Tol biopolymer transport system component
MLQILDLLPAALTRTTLALALASGALAQTTTLVSLDSTGGQGNQFCEAPSISANGRWIAFSGVATNLVAGDTNNQDDIFLRDALNGVTTRVNLASDGSQANGFSQHPRISADGRFVVFESGADNLVAGDTNVKNDLFVHDVQTGATTRISVATGGVQANGTSYAPSISATGRFIAFHSAATNLIAGDTNNAWDVFVHDRQTGATTRVSVATGGAQAAASSSNPSISADGRYVAFQSSASGLVTGDTNATWDIFVHDRQTGITERVSRDAAGVQANGASVDASISADGRVVAFRSAASNLVALDGNAREDVFAFDRLNSSITRCSVASDGTESDNTSRYPAISADGRYVAFESIATGLVASDLNGTWDIFVHDRSSGQTSCASLDLAGVTGNNQSTNAAMSSDGRFVAFQSYATALVANDNNNTGDVFEYDLGAILPFAYCTAGTTTHGCVPAIAYTGTPSASASSGFTITVHSVEGMKQGILFYGVNNSGFVPHPWGGSSSYMCVRAPTQRTHSQNSGGTFNGCDGVLSIDWNAFMATHPTALGNPLQVGQAVYAQAWFRDPPSPKSTMLSDALQFSVGP